MAKHSVLRSGDGDYAAPIPRLSVMVSDIQMSYCQDSGIKRVWVPS